VSLPTPTVLAVALTKGGTGKTTTAANLAAELALRFTEAGGPRRVLLVDADPQGQTGGTLGVPKGSGGLGAVLGAPNPSRLRVAESSLVFDVRTGLDFCPAGPDLAAESSRLGADPAAGLLAVGDALDALAEAAGSRRSAPAVVVVDVPPGWGPLALGVLAASDVCLSPVALHPLALEAVGTFADHLDGVQRTRARFGGPHGRRLPLLSRIVPTMLDRRASAPAQVLVALESSAGEMDRGDGRSPEVGPPIPYSVAVQEAAAYGQTVREYAGASHPAAAAYAALAEAVATDLGL